MKSYLDSGTALEALGGKVVEALGVIVSKARHDLHVYRTRFPDFVAEASERGLANWIHDRLWWHLNRSLEDVDTVKIVESGPTREIIVSETYRIRIKRHDGQGRVRSYPTAGANAFFEQLALQLHLDEGTEVHLTAGYLWEAESREIGAAILSCRDGVDNLIWMVELPEPDEGAPVAPIVGPETPPRPRVGLPTAGSSQASGTSQQ